MTTDIEKNLSERFEVAFNQIHSWLRKNINESIRISFQTY